MKKNIRLTIFTILILISLTKADFVFAQPETIQKPLQNLKDNLYNFFSVKDKSENPALEDQIHIFEQILALSLAEAENIKERLTSFKELSEQDGHFMASTTEQFASFIEYYQLQKTEFDKIKATTTPENLKALALEFKQWRDENLSETMDKTRSFILIQSEKKASRTARERYEKIFSDLGRIKTGETKINLQFEALLTKAGGLLQEAEDINAEAEETFWTWHKATASPDIIITETILTDSASSTEETGTTTPPVESIKDLVRNSLNKIKEAYQIFIEMSDLVRKLFI